MSQHNLASRSTRFRFGRALVVGAVVASLATACASSPATPKVSPSNGLAGQRVVLMTQGDAEAGTVVEVHALDLLKKQGVTVEIRPNEGAPNIAVAQLTSGDVDVYSAGITGGLAAVGAGIPLVDFALGEPHQDYVFLARQGINTLADLKGKKIGVQDTTGLNYAQALVVLQKAGIDVKDVSIVPTGGQSVRVAALVSGRVDATMLSHASQIALQGKGFTTLFDYTKEASQLYDDNWFATKKWLSSHGALAVALNKALLESYVWFSDPSNADAVVNEALAIQPSADRATLVTLFDVLRKDDAYPAGTILDKSSVSAQQDLFVKAGMTAKAVPVDQWVDVSYGEKAKAELK